MEQIPVGLCQCGCGAKTSLYPSNGTNPFMVKGEPRKFIKGHGFRYHRASAREQLTQPKDPSVKLIALTLGQVAIVDAKHYERLNERLWQASRRYGTDVFYAKRTTIVDGIVTEIMMHREVLNYDGPLQIDHISGQTLDNRASNLRLASSTENAGNAKLSKRNTSGLKGVTWHSVAKKWMGQISANGVYRYLGLFSTAAKAHEAYMKAAEELFGEFARAA